MSKLRREVVDVDLKHSALVGVPSIIGFESPASWISRAALSQGATSKEFLEFLGVPKATDPDLILTQNMLTTIESTCGVPVHKFWFAKRMFDNLQKVDSSGKTFLLRVGRSAAYRYCPVCLHTLKTMHFMVHWRFNVWRYCPLHGCLMEDSCRACGRAILLPAEMLTAGPKKEGVAYLDSCMGCGRRLASHWVSVFGKVERKSVTMLEWTQLLRGRASLAAVYYDGLGSLEGTGAHNGLDALLIWEEKGLLPTGSFTLSVQEFEQRLSQIQTSDVHIELDRD